ncbi:hypothetical protein ACSNKN_05860 [Proteus mirabilis]|uniref:hypothetical protein n=1 Tax=Proteus mirabilis TaxID=584 RepID=UPI003F1D6FBC
MKSTVTKNITGLLVLASAALPFAAQAAEKTQSVTITATIDATLTLDVLDTLDLGSAKSKTLDIKTHTNGTSVKLEVTHAEAGDGEYIQLTHKDNDKLKVKTNFEGGKETFSKNVMIKTVPANSAQQTTRLTLTPVPTPQQKAGKYTGTITVKATTL